MQDLAIQFTDGSGKHLYEQIYEYIRDEIKEGKLLVGERLPSTRSLAEYLQVSRSTVDLAYGQLLSEGYHSINEIAESCGFSSVYHFSRAFHNAVGCSPTDYGRNARKRMI